ncbi:MAG: hypothetical protein U0163_04975 [Gemmatimonadaceae bacterium]
MIAQLLARFAWPTKPRSRHRASVWWAAATRGDRQALANGPALLPPTNPRGILDSRTAATMLEVPGIGPAMGKPWCW